MVDRFASRLASALERHRVAVLLLFSAAFFLTTALKAGAKPFWHDEIYTIVYAGLPSLGAMWSAALDGLDLAPPLNTLLTRLAHAIAGVGPVATRLPPMVGFWAMSVVIFSMVRRRSNATLALAALLLPCFTAAYRYSYEARGYGLMSGLLALSVNSWAEAAAGRRRVWHVPLLALTLAAGYWTHYYAVLALLPIAAGEAVRLVRDRKPDWAVWAAVAASCLGALPLRAIAAVAASQSAGFWARPRLGDIGGTYRFLVEPLAEFRFILAAAIIIVAVAAGAVLRSGAARSRERLPGHEVAAGLACVMLPAVAVLTGVFASGAFVPRYALAGIVGLSLAIPLAVQRVASRGRLPEIVLCLVLAASFTESAVRTLLVSPPVFHDPVRERPLLTQQLAGPGPTVATGSLQFLQLWYYTPAELRGRLVYVSDPAAARRYLGSDTIDRGYLALRRWSAVSVVDYAPFVEAHRRFRAYAFGSGWLLARLQDAGARIEETGSERGARVYDIILR